MGCVTNDCGCATNNCNCNCGCGCGNGNGIFGGEGSWWWIIIFLLFFCGNGIGSGGCGSCGCELFEGCNFELLLIAGLAFVVLCGCRR